MSALPPEELRTMAQAIDAGLEPRVQIALDLSQEGAQRLRDLLTGLSADLGRHAGIEMTWPLYRLLAALDDAAG
jgi:hypothetical protein